MRVLLLSGLLLMDALRVFATLLARKLLLLLSHLVIIIIEGLIEYSSVYKKKRSPEVEGLFGGLVGNCLDLLGALGWGLFFLGLDELDVGLFLFDVKSSRGVLILGLMTNDLDLDPLVA